MLRALPYAEPERLVGIWGTHVRTGGRQFLSPAAFLDVKSQTGTLEQVEAVEYVTFNLVTRTGPLRVAGARASAGIFSLLGIGAAHGRTFLQNEDGLGSLPVAVLSYGLWQRQFGSDPRSIGESVTLNGVAHTVIGVVPATLQFPLNGPEVWVPFAMNPEERTVRDTSNIQVFGRLKRSSSAKQAEAELTSMARRQEGQIPQYNEWTSTIIPLDEQMVSDVRQALLLLLVAAGLVLLIACANVGNLLFARSAARHQEISMRIALGARRSRLVRQLLTESLVLAIGGSILGVALAYSVVQALRGIVPPTVLERSRGDFAIDGSVLMFSLAITIRREVTSLDPNLPIYDVRTMDQWIANSLATPRFNVVLLGTFAGLALILASVGIYGVVSYSVTQRTRGLGLRMAVGAQQRDVVAMVRRESLLVVAVGMAVGVAAALLGTRALSGLLFGIGPMDPATWIAVTSMLFAVAFLASYVPARRATRVDPMIALRAE
jgi:ABC-type antimicrobial peptide transport system permease subunit